MNAPANAPLRILGRFARAGLYAFYGHVYAPDALERRFVVEILLDGFPIRHVLAADHVPELAAGGLGDGAYGFSVSLPEAVTSGAMRLEARLANLGTPIAPPIDLAATAPIEPLRRSSIAWAGGRRVIGHTTDPAAFPLSVETADGRPLLSNVRPSGHVAVGAGREVVAARGFSFHLPESLADGGAHRIRIRDAAGADLDGSPMTIRVVEDLLSRAAVGLGPGEAQRAAWIERLIPTSMPFSGYGVWRERFREVARAQPQAKAAAHRLGVVFIGEAGLDRSIDSLAAEEGVFWRAAALEAADVPGSFDPRSLIEALDGELSGVETVVFAHAGFVFEAGALARIGAAAQEAAQGYGDYEVTAPEARAAQPCPLLAFPAFDYERMLEQGYCCHLFWLPRAEARRRASAGAGDLARLFNMGLDADAGARRAIVHLPGPLGAYEAPPDAGFAAAVAGASVQHLQARGEVASVIRIDGVAHPAARVRRAFGEKKVSILIATRDRADLLQQCVASIWPAVKRHDAEVLVIDNDSLEEETLQLFDELRADGVRIVDAPGHFNFARINNRGVEAATGEVLCFLNNDVEALDPNWLGEMLGRQAGPDVAAVGAMLLWPNGLIQHGGVTLGTSFAAAHAYADRMEGDPGYAGDLLVAHERRSLTAACLLVPRPRFEAVGGFDEVRFPVNFNDVDLCLKLAEAGGRLIFTPHARLIHHESASRGRDDAPHKRPRMERELAELRLRWGEILAADPSYSPLLNRDPTPYSGLVWPLTSQALSPRRP